MIKQISSLQHPLVKHLVKLRQNRDYRYDHHTCVVEGIKMLKELAKSHPFKIVMATDPSLIPEGIKSEQLIIATEEVLQKVSGLNHPEGVLGEIFFPAVTNLSNLNSLLVLDGINDPGNMGTLFRTALALGWGGIFIIQESCDPYNEKALRAARGATFRIPFKEGSWEEVAEIAKKEGFTPCLADLKGESPSPIERPLLILSNEAQGPSHGIILETKKISIPMPGDMESLNVATAGGILMYVLRSKP